MWALLLIRTSSAACDAPYTVDEMVGHLSAIEQGLRDGDDAAVAPAAEKLDVGLGCLDSPLNPTLSSRIFRSLGAGLVAADRVEDGTAWMRTSVEIDPGFVYGVDEIAQGHPALTAWDDAQGLVPDPARLSDRQLTDGTWKLDGRSLDHPEASVDRPHILQRSLEGTWSTWRIDGNTFPPEALEALEVVKAPSEKGPKNKKCRKGIRFKGFIDSEGNYCPGTPAEQIVLTFSGPIVLASASLVYLEGYRQFGLTKGAATIEEMRRHKRINNRLVAGSAALAGVGVGLSAFGIGYTGSF